MPESAYWLTGLGLAILGIGVGLFCQSLVLLKPQSTKAVGKFLKKLGTAWIILGLLPFMTGIVFLISHVLHKLMG